MHYVVIKLINVNNFNNTFKTLIIRFLTMLCEVKIKVVENVKTEFKKKTG